MSVDKFFKQVNYPSESKKYRLRCIVCLCIALLIPILAVSGSLQPESESLKIWFQRSGSLVVLFSSFAEFSAFKMLSVFSPVELANECDFVTKLKYSNQAKVLIVISAFFIGIGTVIWGYGDLVV